MLGQVNLEASLSFITNLLGIVAVLIMVITLIIKLKDYHDKTNKWDIIRILMIIWFLGILYFNTWEFLYYNTPLQTVIPTSWIDIDYSTIVIQSYSVPVVIICGLYIVGHANNWLFLKIIPVIYFIIVILLIYLINFTILYLPSMLIGYLAVLVFLLYTGFKLKDNGALGLAIFFILTTFVGISESYVKFILGIIAYAYGVYFALGYFKPFKIKLSEE
ncbi:MAG: hypothetical protein ACFFDF_10795 [Candidatus Odinarchaeota archaeon]